MIKSYTSPTMLVDFDFLAEDILTISVPTGFSAQDDGNLKDLKDVLKF